MSGTFEETEQIYRDQGIGGGRAGFGRSLGVVVVDFQHLYTRGRASTGIGAVERTAELLAHARRAQLPIAYAYVGYPAEERPGDRAWTLKCPGLLEARIGSQACEIDPLITPQRGDVVIDKRIPSALFDDRLATHFRKVGVDTLLVCGTSTSGCVRATVVDGVSKDFRMLVVRECVADRSAPSAAAALFDIDTKYGDVIALADALDHLTDLAGGAR
jgi:maleamate amidohydrolase